MECIAVRRRGALWATPVGDAKAVSRILCAAGCGACARLRRREQHWAANSGVISRRRRGRVGAGCPRTSVAGYICGPAAVPRPGILWLPVAGRDCSAGCGVDGVLGRSRGSGCGGCERAIRRLRGGSTWRGRHQARPRRRLKCAHAVAANAQWRPARRFCAQQAQPSHARALSLGKRCTLLSRHVCRIRHTICQVRERRASSCSTAWMGSRRHLLRRSVSISRSSARRLTASP